MITRLHPAQRDVLLLRVLGGLTVDQVASAMGKSSGAVKALQRRGLAAIDGALAKEGVTL
jgi:DNA-directed RNA polymerase specialized sigma24 family protein